MSEQRQLPDGWRWVQLGDVCERYTGNRTPENDPDTPFFYVDISSVDNVEKRIVAAKELMGKDAPSRARQIIKVNDVIVATTRPNLNAVACVPPELHNQICSTGFCVLRVLPDLDPRYLFAWVQSQDFIQSLSILVQGAMYPAVTDVQVRSQYIPLPPTLAEQQRIAARIEAHMAEIAVARAAAEAELTAAEELTAAYLREVFESEEAQEWDVVELGNVGQVMSGVTLGRRFPEGTVTITVPYLRVANVKDGYLDLDDVYEVAVLPHEAAKWQLEYGDLLLTEGGDPDKLGRGSYWENQIEHCIHQNHIFRVRFDPNCFDPEFLSAQLGSSYGKAYFLKHAKQTTGIATINQQVLKKFPLMVPSLEIQQHIVQTMRQHTLEYEHVRNTIRDQWFALKALPNSVLEQAFNGEL